MSPTKKQVPKNLIFRMDIQAFMIEMKKWTDEERRIFLDQAMEHFCEHCGKDHSGPGPYCQCENEK